MFLLQRPADGGTVYAETNIDHFFPEPFNGVTAAFFLLIAIYFTYRLWGEFKSHPFLTYCLALMYIGGIGGSTYHLFRQWRIFIFMDWVPIMLLCVSAGVYFIALRLKWYWAALIVIIYVIFQFGFRNVIMTNNPQLFINLNYAMMAALVVLPVLANLIVTKWAFGKWVGFALITFAIALTFRIADKWEWLTIGTHFLWHSFGAVASYCMLNYIYLSQRRAEKSVQNIN